MQTTNFTTKIHKLSDAIANQIAAGEVVQRPASVVKELIENAIDAGATRIEIILMEGGLSEIRLIDNGSGMHPIDAQMAFERHATSKIRSVDDIYQINTMGFRGEALPSIASVSKLTLKSRTPDSDLGVLIRFDASKIVEQDMCAIPVGTDISVKNLFFNTPARKKFLKSPHIEFKHITEEIYHIALAHPELTIQVYVDGKLDFQFQETKPIMRCLQVIGKQFQSKLLPIQVETDIVQVHGFIAIPEAARKQRMQYWFVNKRFIKHPYFSHAVSEGFEGLLEEKSFPVFCLYITLNPNKIDVNIHPTKQEVNFEDERIIYTYIKLAVREALSKHAIVPSIDFEKPEGNAEFETFLSGKHDGNTSGTGFSNLMQRFSGEIDNTHAKPLHTFGGGKHTNVYAQSFDTLFSNREEVASEHITIRSESAEPLTHSTTFPVQVFGKYILSCTRSTMILVHQHVAHTQILFEEFMLALSGKPIVMQSEMFPFTWELRAEEAKLVRDLQAEFLRLGYAIEEFGPSTFIIQGTPAGLQNKTALQVLNDTVQAMLADTQKENVYHELMAANLAKASAISDGITLQQQEASHIIDTLFACKQPMLDPFGRKTYIQLSLEQIAYFFSK